MEKEWTDEMGCTTPFRDTRSLVLCLSSSTQTVVIETCGDT